MITKNVSVKETFGRSSSSKYTKMAKISCILKSQCNESVRVCVWVCVCSATDPKVINSANTFVLTQSPGEVFLVFAPLHIICFAQAAYLMKNSMIIPGMRFFPLSHLVTENPVETQASTEEYLYRLIIPILKKSIMCLHLCLYNHFFGVQ